MNKQEQIYRRRMIRHGLGMGLSLFAMGLGVFILIWILGTLLMKGLGGIDWNLLAQSTPAPGNEGGGLLNAFVGSVMMIGISTVMVTPAGVFGGIYLSEYGDKSAFAKGVRFLVDVMLSAPSIVIGLFVYAIYVMHVKHFSGWAGSFALSLIALPVVVRTTDNFLQLVPVGIREAAYALGAPQWKVALMIRLKAARAGIVTGILLAIARISGETAPLLFTALGNQFFSVNLNEPMANLPVMIYQFAMSPYDNWKTLAWAGALLITLGVLALNMISRILFQKQAT